MAYYRLPIKGMTCGHCASKIEKALQKMENVQEAVVNFSAEKLYLTTTEETSLNIFKDKVKELGYELFDDERASLQKNSLWDSQYFRSMLISGGFIILALIITLINPYYSRWAFITAALVALYPVLRQVYTNFKNKSFLGMSTLVTLAVFGALILGEYLEGALVVFLYNVGQVLEFIAASKARKGISQLANIAPDISYKVTDNGVEPVASSSLEIGDIVELRAGTRLAIDGIALSAGDVDESVITGESLPQAKNIQDPLNAGSIGIGSPIRVKVTATSSENSLNRIQELVEEANGRKSPTARQMDAFAEKYTPFVVLLAAATAIIPPLFFGLSWQSWAYSGLGLLLIACPCALVLSTPTAVAAALSVAAKRGILVKSGGTLEGLAQIKNIAFDKTGTLTKGELAVTDIRPFADYKPEEILDIAIQIEQSNNHPLAEAIRNHKGENIQFKEIKDPQTHTGRGASAIYNGDPVAVFSAKAAQEIDPNFKDDNQIIGSKVVVMKNSQAIGLIILQDTIRPDSIKAVQSLKDMGITPIMLTGDNQATAQKIASDINMDVAYELLPAEKLQTIARLKDQAVTAMVGDGINDAPALSEANIGIAMGSGTDVALEVADAALSQNNINHLPFIIGLSRSTRKIIIQNIIFAVSLKLSVGLLSYLIPFGLLDNMPLIKDNYLLLAILADTGATVLVTLNTMRLLTIKDKNETLQPV